MGQRRRRSTTVSRPDASADHPHEALEHGVDLVGDLELDEVSRPDGLTHREVGTLGTSRLESITVPASACTVSTGTVQERSVLSPSHPPTEAIASAVTLSGVASITSDTSAARTGSS